MKIGLVDVDSHNYPNLPLMKISSWHKMKGDHVEFADVTKEYDKVYVSKIFTQSVEPQLPKCKEIYRGGSGYDLENKLPYDIEHMYPDYSLYPEYTKDTAYGFLTRGCPRINHGFCITPKKDGCKSIKTANLDEFWNGQKNIILLDQNLLACKERKDLLNQLAESGANVVFDGGSDARFVTDDILDSLKAIKVRDWHFAWDDPKENLLPKFEMISKSGLVKPKMCGVYVLTNYWSNTEQDIFRVEQLKRLGFAPYVMIFNKHEYVDKKGRWLPDVEKRFSRDELRHFKTCQHLQRYSASRELLYSTDFYNYENYKRWVSKGRPVPVDDGQLKLF